ncbi:MAG: hypothetical protein KIT72_00910 [Polyangiaceae bacterium]|nr:hypothetical protein [Polyangiaceae bacterium]MCW5788956.1 hypothetical protein [Polyangiaceae bacterium]
MPPGHPSRAPSRHRLAALACALLGMSLGSSAAAEPVPSLDLRHFRPPADPNGGLYLEPTRTPGPMAFDVGAWMSYAHHPVSLIDASGDVIGRPLAGQLSMDWFVGLGVGERLGLSLSLPSVLHQFESGGSQGLLTDPLPSMALGDARFGAKATLLPTGSLGGFGLAALASVTAPTGDARSYLAEGQATGELRLLGEYTLIAASLYGTVGARLRLSERDYLGETFGQSLPVGLGASIKPQALGWDDEGRWRWNVEVRSDLSLTPGFARAATSPTALGLSARYTRGSVSGIAGVELPLGDAVGLPTARAVLGLSWSPRFHDQDGDGIEDSKDECPELPEDFDGFEDHDGCPDWDNDGDGVGDDVDQCPNELEDEDDFEDDDGCPDPDNDKDGIPDEEDDCPDEYAPLGTGDGRGCPVFDRDGDGIEDDVDRCPDEPEDKDGFQDDDGCPDPDNDRDGVPDVEDACPNVKGQRREDPELNGCPSPDRDGDTYPDDEDKCPDDPEDFDGVEDQDGCPDPDDDKPAYLRAKPLVTATQRGAEVVLSWRVAPRFKDHEVDPKSEPSVRALAQLLTANPGWIAALGVRPNAGDADAEQLALNRAFQLVSALRRYTYRDNAAESVSWAAVKSLPGAAQHGLGVLLLTPQPARLELKLKTSPRLKPMLKSAPPPRPIPQLGGAKPPTDEE